MKIASRTFAGLGLFVVPFTIVYWTLSREESGTVMLLAVSLALLFLAVYCGFVHRRVASLPEDQAEGVSPDVDEVGVFPTGSVWPVVLGLGATLAAGGFAYGGWLALPGAGIMAIAIGGMVTESGRPR